MVRIYYLLRRSYPNTEQFLMLISGIFCLICITFPVTSTDGIYHFVLNNYTRILTHYKTINHRFTVQKELFQHLFLEIIFLMVLINYIICFHDITRIQINFDVDMFMHNLIETIIFLVYLSPYKSRG